MHIINPNEPAKKPAAPVSMTTRIGTALSKAVAKPAKLSPLAQLVAEGAATKLELQSLDTPLGRKLTAKAFVAASLAMPGASKQEAEKLLQAIDQPENSALLPSFQRLVSRIVEPGSSASWTKIGWFIDEAGANACARLQCHERSFFAAAAMAAARNKPERFGLNNDMKALATRIAALNAKLIEIQRRIGLDWQRSDVTMSPDTEDNKKRGLIRLTLDCTDGAVCVSADMGEQSVNWWISNSALKAA